MKIIHFGLAALLLSSASLARAIPHYTMTVIGPSGSSSTALNDFGAVVGYSGSQSGFIYANGSFTTHKAAGSYATSFVSINNSGAVVGDADMPRIPGPGNESSTSYGVRYANGAFTLYQPPAGVNHAWLRGINDSGAMFGHYYTYPVGRVVVDTGDGPQLLAPQLASSHQAYDMNNLGALVGSVTQNSVDRAVVFDNNGGYSLIGNVAEDSVATAINDNGWIGGFYSISLYYTGSFLRDAAGNVTLFTLPSREIFLSDVNNAGVAVGAAWLPASPDSFGYLFMDGAAIDLNTRLLGSAGWTLVDAAGINENGQIAGTACRASTGLCHAVLLDVSPVPEPGAWAMLLAGLATVGAGGYRARRRRGA